MKSCPTLTNPRDCSPPGSSGQWTGTLALLADYDVHQMGDTESFTVRMAETQKSWSLKDCHWLESLPWIFIWIIDKSLLYMTLIWPNIPFKGPFATATGAILTKKVVVWWGTWKCLWNFYCSNWKALASALGATYSLWNIWQTQKNPSSLENSHEPIIQSEVSQKERHQYSILTHIYGI